MASHVRFTVADLAPLPGRLDAARYELIAGELLVTAQPHWAHQFATGSLGAGLLRWSERTGLGCASIAPSVIFSPQDLVAPDALWISRAPRAGPAARREAL